MNTVRVAQWVFALIACGGLIFWLQLASENGFTPKTLNLKEESVTQAQTASSRPLPRVPPRLAANEEELPQIYTRMTKLYEQWLEDAQNSNNAEDLLILAAVSLQSTKKRETLLLKAYSLAPKDVLVNHQIMEHCFHKKESALCSLPYMDVLTQLAPDNGYICLASASQAYANGDLEKALEMMQETANASYIDDYAVSYLRAIDESFQRSGIERGFMSLASYISVVPIMSGQPYMAYYDMCKKQIGFNAAGWQQACYKVSETLSQNIGSEIGHIIGETNKIIFSSLPAEEITAELELHRQNRDFPNEDMMRTEHILTSRVSTTFSDIPISDKLWREFLEAKETQGHDKAITSLFTKMIDIEENASP